MKRITFSVMMALASMVANAQEGAATWTATLNTTEKVADLQRGAPMAIDNEGNAIVTGTYTKEVDFASSYLEPIATSAFVAKYDKAGNKKWAAGLKGAATVKAVANDAEGNIYVAGNFADIVEILDGTGEQKATINGKEGVTSQISAFIVKYSKDGDYVASKVIIPEQARNDESYGDPAPEFIPNKLLASNGKVYLAASFQGNSKINDLTLVGQYGSMSGIYTWDVPTLSVVSLSADFAQAELVAQMAATDNETELGYRAEDVNFTTDGSKVYVAFVAYGDNLTLKSANGSKQITDLLKSVIDGDTKYESAFIVATIENGNIAAMQTYHSKIDENIRSAKFNTVDEMAFKNGNLYLAGTFNETFPFDNSKAYEGGCDTYVACLKASDLSKNWAVTSGYNEGDVKKKAEVVTGMAVFDDEVHLTGWAEATKGHVVETPLNFFADNDVVPSSMRLVEGANALFATSVANNGGYTIAQSDNKAEENATEGVYTYKFYDDDDNGETGVDNVLADDNTIGWDGNTVTLAKAADVELFSANGTLVLAAKNTTKLSLANVARGVYMVKAGKKTAKIVF